jgi:hypothetical protein
MAAEHSIRRKAATAAAAAAAAATASTPLLDTSDILLLGVLLIGGVYWVWRSRSNSKGNAGDAATPNRGSNSQSQRSQVATNEKSLVSKFTKDGKDLVILFGSQTGTGTTWVVGSLIFAIIPLFWKPLESNVKLEVY